MRSLFAALLLCFCLIASQSKADVGNQYDVLIPGQFHGVKKVHHRHVKRGNRHEPRRDARSDSWTMTRRDSSLVIPGRRMQLASAGGADEWGMIAGSRNLSGAIAIPQHASKPDRGLVVLRTDRGLPYVVAAGAANAFAGFVSWLESTGYRITEIGGYAFRRIAGTHTISNHARGTAIDINQTERNRVTRRFPAGTTEMAERFGLLHGAVWRHPDTGHFEVVGSRKFAVIGPERSERRKRYARRHHRHRRVHVAAG